MSITSTDIRLFSDKNYPPTRGTLLSLSETQGVLYTKGIVDFYKTYPGMYIPSPLRVEAFESDSSLEDLCKEILGLTKMNWNNTQLGWTPTHHFGVRQQGWSIMKYVDASEKPQVSYSFYMCESIRPIRSGTSCTATKDDHEQEEAPTHSSPRLPGIHRVIRSV